MKLSIIDIEKITQYAVAWIELNTPVGNIVIQAEHAPMIIQLSPNHELIFELLSGEQKSIMMIQAIAHITRDEVKIITPGII